RVGVVNDVAGVASYQAALMREAGYDVEFHSIPQLGASWPALAKWLVMPVRLAQLVPLIATLRRREYDVLHLHSVSLGFVGMVAGTPDAINAHVSHLHPNFMYLILMDARSIALRDTRRSR